VARPYLEKLGHPVTKADVAKVARINGAYTTAAIIEAVSSHGGAAAFWTEEVAKKYTPPVVVLIGEDTGSAGEGFAWLMRLRTHARLIGRKTAGALLSSEPFDLGGRPRRGSARADRLDAGRCLRGARSGSRGGAPDDREALTRVPFLGSAIP
jgi:hypothetical protein